MKYDVPRLRGEMRGHVEDASQRHGPLFMADVTAMLTSYHIYPTFIKLIICKLK